VLPTRGDGERREGLGETMDMAWMDLPKEISNAVSFFWKTRQTQTRAQKDRGGSDTGSRAAVTGGGKQLSRCYCWSFDYLRWRPEAERRLGRTSRGEEVSGGET